MAEPTVASLKKENAKLKKDVTAARKKESAANARIVQVRSEMEEIFLDDQFNWTEFRANPDDVFTKLFGK